MASGSIRRISAGRVTAFLLLGAAITFFALLYTGFCFSRMEFLSEAEFIERALLARSHDIKGMPIRPSRADVLAYLRDNPSCCRIDNFPRNNSFLDKLFGLKIVWVRIIHPRREDQISTSESHYTHYEAYMPVFRCGGTGGRIGTSLTEAEAKEKILR
jgi:hypothetical protein